MIDLVGKLPFAVLVVIGFVDQNFDTFVSVRFFGGCLGHCVQLSDVVFVNSEGEENAIFFDSARHAFLFVCVVGRGEGKRVLNVGNHDVTILSRTGMDKISDPGKQQAIIKNHMENSMIVINVFCQTNSNCVEG
eukprot:TRINITY_DN791_c0_g1_i4.p1 TRINITY_DN791_c0_g1~~TRINITY_DN791_c0_g1_i4.p1  ORF type:complete len:134 (+),score=4.12 TRINITY_DN791_c0_g1_i4:106-507(+)